jgi:hypothetical protein
MQSSSGSSLRGYGRAVLKRDFWTCQYCGLDGKVWPKWLFLSIDHLLPVGHANPANPDFIVTACVSCNGFANRTIYDTEGKAPQQLLEQKRPVVQGRRDEFHQFWMAEVATPTRNTQE